MQNKYFIPLFQNSNFRLNFSRNFCHQIKLIFIFKNISIQITKWLAAILGPYAPLVLSGLNSLTQPIDIQSNYFYDFLYIKAYKLSDILIQTNIS